MPIRKATSAPTAPTAETVPTGADYTPAETEENLWENENPDEQAPESSGMGGWGALDKAREERKKSGGGGNAFQFSDEARPVLFLSAGPVNVYERHWVNRKEEKARRSFKCIARKGSEITCPLCAIGNKATLRADFQVLDLEFEGDEIIEKPRVMNLGVQAAELLEAIDNDERKGPLQGHWFAVYTTGTRPKITHHFEWIKERDLEEDWGIPLEGAKQFAEQYVGKVEYKNYPPDLEELQEIAAEIKKG